MTLATVSNMVLSPDDFNPPLKRTEVAVPYYWTVEELAAELGMSKRYVISLINGDPRKKDPLPQLKAHKVGAILLIPDIEALTYLWKVRQEGITPRKRKS